LRLVLDVPPDKTRQPDLAGLMKTRSGSLSPAFLTSVRSPIASRASDAMQVIVDTRPLETGHAASRLQAGARGGDASAARFPRAQDALFSLLQNGRSWWRFE
jgi:hypothetical protein